MILLSFTVGVKIASAETKMIHLTLDAGFVGRPVQLDLFDGDVSISWGSEALKAPTFLVVSVEDVDTSEQGSAPASSRIAGNTVRMLFADGGAINTEKGVFTIRERALTPPASTERPVIFFEKTSSTAQGTFSDDSVTFHLPARANFSITPRYEEGIMRSGMASWYRYKNCLCAASPDVPKGTRLKVSRQDDPSRFVIVTVNDYGPDRRIHPERVIDLDYVAFAKIANPRGGVLAVNVEKVE
jgi:hypothetical protein